MLFVIENQLNTTTSYTQRQKEGFGAIINNKKQTIKVKYTVVGFNYKKNPEVEISKENIIKSRKEKENCNFRKSKESKVHV